MRWNDLRLEIVDMDDSKIDRLLIHQQSDRSETAPEIKADD